MSDDVKAAAERDELIRECRSSINWLEGGWVHDYPKSAGHDDGLYEAMKETADTFDDLLAWFKEEHPADESELITDDWLESLGFGRAGNRSRMTIAMPDHGGFAGNLSIEGSAFITQGNEPPGSDDDDVSCVMVPVKTRRDLRQLCRALGITLNEKE